MRCPICNDVRMGEVEKDGVMIDVCPECKGVWLDRGELEKLMKEIREIRPAFNEWYDEREYDNHRETRHSEYDNDIPRSYDRKDARYGNDKGYHKRKKKSVLDVFGDLFD
ncbi:zf-TFIIB domain-containing protein [Paenibacillus sanguinis]|uniref:TFIIB-type zinc ribbon-containing protein n=1 Tax=Paenibacillus sanguinis TaxID=225906 RepID=UPI00037106DB|nr:zf-TFIIB domain-containing protein [Paenibacillus sanguinis]